MHTIWLLILTFVPIASYTHAAGNLKHCSLQRIYFLETGREGFIEFACPEATSLYWYFGIDSTGVRPFIFIDNSGKHGPGYLSGEYDIKVNGSLVITNVSSEHRGVYEVVIIKHGNPEPQTEQCTVDVYEPEETDVKKASDCDQERKTANAEKITTITTDEPGKITTDLLNENDMDDIKSFQAEINRLKRLDRATLALLVIALLGIGLVVWRSFTAKSTKNPNCEGVKVQCHQQLNRLVDSCHGNCSHGNSNETVDS